jgi:hypothetical protein
MHLSTPRRLTPFAKSLVQAISLSALLMILAGCGESGGSAPAGNAVPAVGSAAPTTPGVTAPPVIGATAPTSKSVGHVFMIVLENKSYSRAFGATPGSSYLGTTLPSMGVLLRQYYGTGHASLDNYITMISGQPPNAITQADCPVFMDMSPGVVDPTSIGNIVIGQGCVFPTATSNIADQLEAAKLTWKGYMQDIDDGTTHSCRHPAINSQDTTESATAANQYATRHDPFMYFHSIIDDQARCDAHVIDLKLMDADLQSEATTPNFSFITPDLCADGHDSTCADPTQPGGFAGIDAFLRTVVPKIISSPAFLKDGLLLITFDESDDNPTDGNNACCDEQTGPNTTAPGAGNAGTNPTFLTYAGGGIIGGVIISPFTKPGTVSDVPYNHYSMLRSVENLFGLGHIGFAAQDGLVPFGADVYNNGVVPAGAGK